MSNIEHVKSMCRIGTLGGLSGQRSRAGPLRHVGNDCARMSRIRENEGVTTDLAPFPPLSLYPLNISPKTFEPYPGHPSRKQ